MSRLFTAIVALFVVFIAVVAGFMTAFPDLRVLMDDLQIDGNRVVYHGALLDTSDGPGGIGRRVNLRDMKKGAWARMA